MSRRSSRLVEGGYYNSDEESDSSTITNKYRENPVKVFKKKAGPRKAGSRTSSRANSNDSSAIADPVTSADKHDGVSPSPLSIQSETTMRTVPYTPTTATPRPALTPSSRSHTPVRSPLAPPEKTPYAGLGSSIRPGLHSRPNHKNQSQSGVDSSGYSSSEGAYKKPTSSSSSPGRVCCRSGAPSTGYWTRISSAFFRLLDSVCLTAEAAQSRVMQQASLASASLSSPMRKAFGLSLLLIVVILCIWFLLPFFTSFFSRMTVMKTPSLTKPKTEPVLPPAPPSQPSTIQPTPVLDPATVSAAVEAKMQHLLVELQLKQDHLLTQMQERLQLDLKKIRENVEALDSQTRLRLEEQVSGLGRQMEDYQSDSRSAAASLSLRIQAMEAQNAKLSQELSSIQLSPPPVAAPCPDPAPVQNQLTPELQQAMEKWLTDRIKEHEAVRVLDKAGSSDCGRPMADKMADFALETQGASVISTRCSETYRIRSACVTLFGFPLWYPSESPRTVIQGYPVLLPGKCWAFHGVQGTLVISLSHPIRITHVTVDHLPRYNSPTGRIDSAPKDFQIYGMKNDTEEGTLLGTFTYNENGESTQTFQLPNPSDVVYRCVELRVLSNWGHIEYTCLYRFRVHGKMVST
ncbi:uncharacterized protein sun2 isoform X2 [Sphaeramia orbicularis]|nr:SUN domain-containing protein 2 isoform X2 [Sphaeramia orbicularis]XP_030017485.1 SUN domain-containing protein 2 isoform X2 [Sphaeramia orbicularis]XP_030017557.1 SUN domain-containing protein 2 isoform X2 [Sphaeramia orbicularis]